MSFMYWIESSGSHPNFHFFLCAFFSSPQVKENVESANKMCTKCGECLEKCPQSIEIPDELERAVEIWENGKKIDEFYNTN